MHSALRTIPLVNHSNETMWSFLGHVVDVFLIIGFVTEITTVETAVTNKIVVSVYDHVARYCVQCLRFILIFTRTSLRYVRVFAVVIPSVVCLPVCRLSSVTLVHPT